MKAPGYGDRRKAMLEDIATITGGRALTEDLGIRLENLKVEDLGRAKKVTIGKDHTMIVEGAGTSEAIQGRDQAAAHPDRGRDLGLRPREAAGAPGEDGRRRGHHQGGCGHGDPR